MSPRVGLIAGLLLLFSAAICVALGARAASDTSARDEQPSIEDNGLHVHRVDVDGREITCVVFSGIDKGGLSCDWPQEAR